MCLTETQHRHVKVDIEDNIEHIHSHRDGKDGEGGG